MSNYRNIGKLVASFGVDGEMVLHHRLGKKTSLKGLKVIFLEDKKDELLPWFIGSTRIKSAEDIHVKLEGIDSKEATRKLLQKEVWLTEEDFARFAGASAPISLVGFSLIQGAENLGEILEVIEQPHQVLCRIDWKGKEALIPIHEGTLGKIDKKNRKVHVVLPDGLLEVYG
ncbi:MAG: 16S rRNA processing protein RimM [Puia sp.]|nr:16S rRNA processing protein RimM [Puia sp.]